MVRDFVVAVPPPPECEGADKKLGRTEPLKNVFTPKDKHSRGTGLAGLPPVANALNRNGQHCRRFTGGAAEMPAFFKLGKLLLYH